MRENTHFAIVNLHSRYFLIHNAGDIKESVGLKCRRKSLERPFGRGSDLIGIQLADGRILQRTCRRQSGPKSNDVIDIQVAPMLGKDYLGLNFRDQGLYDLYDIEKRNGIESI